MSKISLQRGDIIDVDLQGATGVEKMNDPKAGSRPCVVVQNDVGNAKSPMTIVAPLTDVGQYKNLPVQVRVAPSDLGFMGAKESVIECGHVRAIDRDARIAGVRGKLASEALRRVDLALAVSLGLGKTPLRP